MKTEGRKNEGEKKKVCRKREREREKMAGIELGLGLLKSGSAEKKRKMERKKGIEPSPLKHTAPTTLYQPGVNTVPPHSGCAQWT